MIYSFQAEDSFLSVRKRRIHTAPTVLAENSGKCGTLYAHAKGKNKDRIQDNVDNSTDNVVIILILANP